MGYWTNPMHTAAVFVPVLAAMLAISVYSLITVISSTCLLVLLAVSASKTYTHLMIKLSKLPDSPSSDPLHKLYSLDMKISAEHVESIISSSIEGINSVLENLRSLFLFENVLDSIKFGVILYAVTFIGCMFNLLTCLILSWISSSPSLVCTLRRRMRLMAWLSSYKYRWT